MKDNFEQWLNDNSITEVECLVPDLGGIARGKILPTNKFLHLIVASDLSSFFENPIRFRLSNCLSFNSFNWLILTFR